MDTSQSEPALASRVRSAVIWRSGSQIAAQILMWTATIIVVRLLDPEDYGLFAMSQVVLVALNFLNGHSFASSLIQEEEVSEHRISQVFGLLLLFNTVLATAQFIAAPFVADYYNQPLIVDMLHVQMLLYLITPFISLPIVLLARQLNFKAQAKADMAGAIVGASTALTGAYFGAGVWTLVIAPMMQQATRAIGLSLAAGHLTRPSFNFKGAGSVLTFGSALVACQFFWVVQSQSDIVIAGPQFDPHHLGLYTEALFLTLIFTAKFIPPLNEVAFPAYTQLAKEGGDVGKAFIATARMLMFAATPLYLGMSVVAGPLVDTLFGPKWHEMVPLVAGLPLAMPFFALQIICSPTTNAQGRPQIYLKSSICGAAIMASCFWVGSRWGAEGLVHAWQFGAPTLLLVTLGLTLPAINVRWRDLLIAIAPSVAAAVAMASVVGYVERLITGLVPAAELGLLAALGVTVYIALIWGFSRSLIEDLFRFVTKRELGRGAVSTPNSQAV